MAAISMVTVHGCSAGKSADSGAGDSGVVDSSLPSDASTPDSGSVDSGPVDSGPLDGPRPPEDCTGLAYCDDFEAYGEDAGLDDAGLIKSGAILGPWKASFGSKTTMTVDSVRAYTGHKALHIKIDGPTAASTGGFLGASVPPTGVVTGNTMFGRAMFYFAPPAENAVDAGNVGDAGDAGDAAPPNGLPSRVHSSFFRITGKYTPEDAAVVMDVGDSQTVLFLNYFPPLHFEENKSGGDVTPNGWHCLQWQFDGSASPPIIHSQVLLDQQPVVNVPVDAGWVNATPWSAMGFGFILLNPETNPIDLSLDTFALDENPIACP